MSAPRKKPVQVRPTSAAAFGPNLARRAQTAIRDNRRIDLGHEPEVANTVTERQIEERRGKGIRVAGRGGVGITGPGFTSQGWVTTTKVTATERKSSGMGFGVRNAAMDARWDKDKGAGASRKVPTGTEQPTGYTSRDNVGDSPTAEAMRRLRDRNLLLGPPKSFNS